jgi:hypothetical protein
MMARTPVGTTPQAQSTTALAAHIASRLAGVGSGRTDRDAWLRALGTRVRSNGADRAAARAKHAVRDWVLVDESHLPVPVEKAIVVFPGRGGRRPRLLKKLRELGCVRQLVLTRSRRDLIAVLLYLPDERDQIFGDLERLGQPFFWDDVLEEDRRVEAQAWEAIARRAAPKERLA